MENVVRNENIFIVGIDFSYQYTTISYFDTNTEKSVIYNQSGGYKSAYIPNELILNQESEEWVIGQEARLCQDTESICIHNLYEFLIHDKEIQIGDEILSSDKVLHIFMGKIIHNLSFINPSIHIQLVTVALPDEAYAQLRSIFKHTVKEIINAKTIILPFSECILQYIRHTNNEVVSSITVIDLEVQKLGLYTLCKEHQFYIRKNGRNIKQISESKIFQVFENIVIEKYLKKINQASITPIEQKKLEILLKENFYRYLQKPINKQRLNIYCTFTYPPFALSIEIEEINAIIQLFRDQFIPYLEEIKENNRVVIVGSGFGLSWFQELVQENVNVMNNNPRDIIALGACQMGYDYFNSINCTLLKLEERVGKEYGVIINREDQEIFLPLVYQDDPFSIKKKYCFILEIEINEKPKIEILSVDENQESQVEKTVVLDINKASRSFYQKDKNMDIERKPVKIRTVLEVWFNSRKEIQVKGTILQL